MNNWEIVEQVSKALDVPESIIVGKSRKPYIVDAKTIIAFKIYSQTGLKLNDIFDVIYHNRQTKQKHCSVINLLKRYEALGNYDKEFKLKIELCKDI